MRSFIVLASLVSELAGGGQNDPPLVLNVAKNTLVLPHNDSRNLRLAPNLIPKIWILLEFPPKMLEFISLILRIFEKRDEYFFENISASRFLDDCDKSLMKMLGEGGLGLSLPFLS